MSKSKLDLSGLEDFIGMLQEFKRLDGKDIRDSIFSNETTISETPEKAKERSDYESYLKTGESSIDEEALNRNISHFVNDIIKKHI